LRVLFVTKSVGLTEPLGIMYLSSALKSAGHQTFFLNAEHSRDPLAQAESFSPDILAYSLTTGLQNYYLSLNRQLRQRLPQALSVFGGPHATFFPEMIEEEGVDVVCRGEGEQAIVELAERLSSGKSIAEIQNLWVKDNGRIRHNPPRPLVTDLDSIQHPDRQLVYAQDRWVREYPIKHFITTRGCPYDCTYCFNHALAEIYSRESGGGSKRVRLRSVDDLIAEAKEVASQYPLQLVRFVSDIFILSRQWLAEFAEKFPKEIGLPFSCNVRANLIDEEVASLLKTGGCISVLMGVESGDEELRNRVLGRRMSTETIVNAAKCLHRQHIAIYSQNMLGLPGETFKQALSTMQLNSKIKAEFAWASIFQPYPRTRLGEYAVNKGYYDGSYSDLEITYHSRSPLTFKVKGDKRRIESLHRLFSLGAAMPALTGVVQETCILPPNPLTTLLYRLWYGLALKSRIFPIRYNPRLFLSSIARFFRKDRG
jgi:anaerobic magnesium-protoporphyrin IX monomethyl ester cyclase